MQITNQSIAQEFCEFRAKCGLLWCYDWVSIPMVYTQVRPPGFVLYTQVSQPTWIPGTSSVWVPVLWY